jgi:hypothetical protein
MDRIDKSKLIHPAECFQRAEFERRQAEYHFAHLSKIEASPGTLRCSDNFSDTSMIGLS